MFADLQQHIVLNIAAIIGVAALALRDQLKLRFLLLVSSLLSLLKSVETDGSALDDMFWIAVSVLINVYVIVLLILDRTHVGLSAEEERLFQAFGSLTPGEFRTLNRLADWHSAAVETVLTEEGIPPTSLFYVLEGAITIEKAGRQTLIECPTFIGEVAFIKEGHASATVRIGPGTRYLSWPTSRLRQSFLKRQEMRVAVMRLLSADLALKVARA